MIEIYTTRYCPYCHAAKRLLSRKGVEFTREPVTIRPGVRICFIRGPQGISVELLERDKKYA